MGRKPSNELIKITELTKKLTKNNIIYRRNLLRKASTYLECSGYKNLSDEKVADIVKKAVKKLKREGELLSDRIGREAIYFHPNLQDKAEEMKISSKEKEIKLPKKFLPIINKWLEEFPEIAENDFGIYFSGFDEAELGNEFRRFILKNINKMFSCTFKYKTKLPFAECAINGKEGLPKLDIEFNPLFDEMMNHSRKLKFLWKSFKEKSVKLWKGILELEELIKKLVLDEFGLKLSPPFCQYQDSVSENLIALLIIFAYSQASEEDYYQDYVGELPLIIGVRLKEKEILFRKPSNYVFNGEFFERGKPEQISCLIRKNGKEIKWHIVAPPEWNLADAYIFQMRNRDYIILSKNWIIKNLQEKDIVKAFDNFCITHLNNLFRRVREGTILERAKELYELKKDLWRLHEKLRYTLEKIKYEMEYSH